MQPRPLYCTAPLQADPTFAELTGEAEEQAAPAPTVANGYSGSQDKLNGQLKLHLDSIFSGFQKLISGSGDIPQNRKLPFVIEKTIHNIIFIKTHMQRQDEFDAVSKNL